MSQPPTPRPRPTGSDTPTRAASRRSGWIALLVALLLVLSACGWFSGDPGPTAEPAPPAPVETEPTPGPVEIAGAPDGVEVGEPETVEDLGGGAYFVSQVYPVSGPALEQPVLVTIELDSGLPEGTPLTIASREDADAPWTFLEARLDTDGRHAEFITAGLGSFGVVALDTASVRSAWNGALDTALERDARRPKGVEAPTCESTEAARDEGTFRAKSWKRKTVLWCFDLVGDQRLLRITNPRGVPVRVSAPDAGNGGLEGDLARPGLDWTAWLAALGAGTPRTDAAPAGADLGGTDTFVPPGRTLLVDVDLEPDARVLVTAADDERGRAVQVLHAMAGATAERVRSFGVGDPDPEELFATWSALPACQRALATTGEAVGPALVKGCLGARSLTRSFGTTSLLLGPVLSDRETRTDVAERVATLAESVGRLEQRIMVRRVEPDFSALTGRYRSAGRTLVVDAEGLVTETVTEGGSPIISLTYQLDEPEGQGARAQASATLRSVTVGDRSQVRGALPRVGATGSLALVRGVVTSAFLQSTYCSDAARSSCQAEASASEGQGDADAEESGPRRPRGRP